MQRFYILIVSFLATLTAMDGSSQPSVDGQQQGARPSNKRLQQTQAQVDEVVGIMKVGLI